MDALAAHWGVTPGGNWEGRTILTTAAAAPAAEVLAAGRAAMLAARERRVRPARDGKQLAAWNGMALRAIATVALVLGQERHADATRRLVTFVRTNLLRDDDRVWRTARDGRAHTPGFAEDYANLADGLLAAHAALGEPEDLRLAVRLMDRLIADFWDEASGTLFDTAEEHDRAVARPRSIVDSATPSANAVSRPTCCCAWRCSPARQTTTAAPAASCAPWRRPSTDSHRRSAECSAPWIAASLHRSMR